jgi:hypothetical protein
VLQAYGRTSANAAGRRSPNAALWNRTVARSTARPCPSPSTSDAPSCTSVKSAATLPPTSRTTSATCARSIRDIRPWVGRTMTEDSTSLAVAAVRRGRGRRGRTGMALLWRSPVLNEAAQSRQFRMTSTSPCEEVT